MAIDPKPVIRAAIWRHMRPRIPATDSQASPMKRGGSFCAASFLLDFAKRRYWR